MGKLKVQELSRGDVSGKCNEEDFIIEKALFLGPKNNKFLADFDRPMLRASRRL